MASNSCICSDFHLLRKPLRIEDHLLPPAAVPARDRCASHSSCVPRQMRRVTSARLGQDVMLIVIITFHTDDRLGYALILNLFRAWRKVVELMAAMSAAD
jgi:hypothetical protein